MIILQVMPFVSANGAWGGPVAVAAGQTLAHAELGHDVSHDGAINHADPHPRGFRNDIGRQPYQSVAPPGLRESCPRGHGARVPDTSRS